MDQFANSLSQLGQDMWNMRLTDSDLATLEEKALELSTHVIVHRTLLVTLHDLGKGELSTKHYDRIRKFMKTVYRAPEKEAKHEERWKQLRNMDCACFLFISMSYTPLAISKMSDPQFKYLIKIISDFLRPPRICVKWEYQTKVRVIVGTFADEFKTKYDRLLTEILEADDSPSNMSETQGGSGGSHDWFGPVSAMDISILNDEESDTGGSRKRRHQHVQATNAKPPQTKKQKGVGDKLKAQTTRQIQFMFSQASKSQIPVFANLVTDALRTSSQWELETARNQSRTDCLNMIVPKNPTLDISITLLVGQEAATQLRKQLGLLPTWSSSHDHQLL